MRRSIAAVLVVGAAAACGGRKEPAPKAAKDATAPIADAAPAAAAEPCEKLPFVETISVLEASGSALLPEGLLVAGDSGNNGAYVILDPDTGAEREAGSLPLGNRKKNADDVEGLAVRDGALYGLTSPGFVLKWERTKGKAYALVDGPYPLAAASTGLSCAERDVNCGKNYEGICLRSGAVPAGECVGLAASKADGALYCLVEAGGRLTATPDAIAVTSSERLTGCDVAPDGAVWAGTNLFDASRVYSITGWTTPASAKVVEVGTLGAGFPESIAVGPDDVVYRFSDVPNGAPSVVAKFRCTNAGR